MKNFFIKYIIRKFQRQYIVSYNDGETFGCEFDVWAFSKKHAMNKILHERYGKYFRASIQEYQTVE